MQTVKAIKALPGRQEGAVFQVDEVSAEALRERGDVEFVDEAPEAGGLFTRNTTRRSGAAVTQVAAADYPEQVVGEPAEGQEGEAAEVVDGDGATHSGVLPAPTRNANKADLVAFAAGKVTHDDGTAYTEAELESLTKPELADKLGL
ncbi:hypothetical protein [Mycolicibacterium mageritense]|uniref:hypothetical protein n=1 Tax=Mycolicibacterium mageritense TaxID=53462 RepID=UPI001E5840FF|nr:hypothetical protein [Mycolicibacterium mageritense]GJJ23736.1 hypothetical protein MTY414_74090 [Mycolicibacterium mageritense]